MIKLTSVFVISVLFVVNIYAEATTCTCESLNADILALQTTITQQQDLVSGLSDDIGVMADRIGDMADKIVATEHLLSETLLALTGNATLTNSVALLSPADSTSASKTTAPNISLSDSAAKYLLHASTSATFERTKSIVIYVDSNDALTNAWVQVANLATTNSDVVFIAVQSINENVISVLSNSAKLTLQ